MNMSLKITKILKIKEIHVYLNINLVLTGDHFSRDTHMRIILGNKAVLKKSTSDTK